MSRLSESFPLYGGGFLVALLQNSVVYYLVASLLHFVVPRILKVQSIQVGQRKPHQVLTEATNCIGAYQATYGGLCRRCLAECRD